MENELENMSKKELIRQLLAFQKSNQKLESISLKKDEDIAKKFLFT